MALSQALQDEIDAIIDTISSHTNSLYQVSATLQRLLVDSDDFDSAIQSVDPTFDLETMYENLVDDLKAEANTIAQDLVTDL